MKTFAITALVIFAVPLGFILFVACIGAILTMVTRERWL